MTRSRFRLWHVSLALQTCGCPSSAMHRVCRVSRVESLTEREDSEQREDIQAGSSSKRECRAALIDEQADRT